MATVSYDLTDTSQTKQISGLEHFEVQTLTLSSISIRPSLVALPKFPSLLECSIATLSINILSRVIKLRNIFILQAIQIWGNPTNYVRPLKQSGDNRTVSKASTAAATWWELAIVLDYWHLTCWLAASGVFPLDSKFAYQDGQVFPSAPDTGNVFWSTVYVQGGGRGGGGGV